MSLFHSSILFYLSAILPQYVVWPYLAYYDSAGQPLFLSGIGATVLHWIIVLAIYIYVSKHASLPKSIGLFLLISAISILLAHALLTLAGYQFSVDWL